jgi:hypothetical protein
MVRKRVNLQWIAKDSTRQATFTKRRNALVKKARELSTLCGIKVSVVVYGDDQSKPPEVYPSVPEARELLRSFKAMPDHLEKLKKKMNMEEYLRGRISKLQDQMCKNDRERGENETSHNLHDAMAGNSTVVLAGLSNEELIKLDSLVQGKIMDAKERFKQLGLGQGSFQEPPPLPLLEKPTLSSQLQSPYIYSDIHTLVPTEPQPHQENWLPGQHWNERDFRYVGYNDLGISHGGAGPSSSQGGTTEYYNTRGSGFP